VAAEAFLGAEVVFREEVAISLQVKGVFPEVAAVSLAVVVSLGAAVFLAAAEVVSPGAAAVFLVALVAAFPGATILFPAGAVAVPLDTVLRAILHCSPISADRDRVAAEYHRVLPEVNQAAVVHRWEEARHSCPPAIDQAATWEVEHRNFPLAMKAEHVQARSHPSARLEAMPAIFSVSPAGSEPALRWVGLSRIGLINFPRIVLPVVKSPLLLTNAQIGAIAR
jgi:hypothetical protein